MTPFLSPADFREIVSGRRTDVRAAITRAALSALELPYHVAVSLRNRSFDRNPSRITRTGVPVISVGNVTLGGTGKSPLIAWLAQWFRDRNVRVAVISRGYGAQYGSQNDESLELEQLLPDVPHLQNPDRVAAAQVAVDELDMQVLLLDDAFQHRRIHRDLDIVLLDATAPFGYDHVFPRGMLRESLRALARADVIALSRADLVSPSERQTIRETARHYAPSAQWIEIIHQPQDWIDAQGSRHPLESLRNQRVAAFCGIGNPHAFRQALSHCGCDVVELREFPDHHPYHRDDIQTLSKWIDSISPVDSVVCTHKDLVKIGLMRIDRLPLLALRIGIQFQAGKESFEKLLAAFAP
ncbi:MAG: tetraacyldisaccharide 4'-kinase [Pirellulaceae bacterium]